MVLDSTIAGDREEIGHRLADPPEFRAGVRRALDGETITALLENQLFGLLAPDAPGEREVGARSLNCTGRLGVVQSLERADQRENVDQRRLWARVDPVAGHKAVEDVGDHSEIVIDTPPTRAWIHQQVAITSSALQRWRLAMVSP